ncbi:SA1362 family protein [Bacillus salitolerans]|uniref:SA1362 family protein n=1 Tax=Bacillus salitolerans TaxID=1437434 RepID=A0ABW4LMX1_9BACI
MKRQTGQIILILTIGLAAIGLLTTNPLKLLQMIGIAVLFAFAFYLIFRFLQKRAGGNWKNNSQYRKAVRQSRKRYQSNNVSTLAKKPVSPTTLKRKSSNTHLTVIEGKKNNKKKNRAFH